MNAIIKYRNRETNAQNDIGHKIPKVPGRSWLQELQEVKRKITRSGNVHERPSVSVAPLSAANGPIRTAGPSSIRQKSVVRSPETPGNGIGLLPVSRPFSLEASGASDGVSVQDRLGTTDVQATIQPSSVTQETISANTEDIAAPDAGDTPSMPLKKKTQTLNPSSNVDSNLQSGTRLNTTAPDIAQIINIAMDDRAPATGQASTAKQKSKNLDDGPEQMQNLMTVPARLDDGESPAERAAKEKVKEALYWYLSEWEKERIAILVDIEDYKGSRRLCVKCFDGAADKANEIDMILSRYGTRLSGFPYVVHRRGKTKIFGYKGNDTDRIDGPTAINSEKSRDDLIAPFSNTPYWTRGSTMVEAFRGDKRNGNMVGAPIRMTINRRDGSSAVSMWTCGGIIKIDGANYGLTTAHPFVLRGSVRPQKSPHEGSPSEDDEMANNGPFGGKDDFFSAEHHPERYWQATGKVSHYALARMRSIPTNNDWLLFELPEDQPMWNHFWNPKSSRHALAVFTARGPLAANILKGTAFLILGNSPFEVLKIGLGEPLRPGDSGSWLVRGNELVGVMIAGSEEDPERPIGYAISAHEIFHSISTSLGGLAVRPLTLLENAINANHIRGTRRDLVDLRIRQLFDLDAPVRRIKTLPSHHTLSSLANIQTGDTALTALLQLGSCCLLIGLDFTSTRRHHLTLTPSLERTKRIGERLRQQMSQFREGVAVTDLILALSASLPLSDVRARARECARALSTLMDELSITPSPTQNHLRALVRSVCNRHTLPKALDVHYGGTKEATSPISLARSLGRAMYAIRTDNFFVYEGVTAKYLRKFLQTYTRYPVIAVHDDMKDVLTDDMITNGVVPRIFVITFKKHLPHNTKAKAPFYGKVVGFDELNAALEESFTTYLES